MQATLNFYPGVTWGRALVHKNFSTASDNGTIMLGMPGLISSVLLMLMVEDRLIFTGFLKFDEIECVYIILRSKTHDLTTNINLANQRSSSYSPQN